MRIDIFELGTFEKDECPNPERDIVWWTGCLTIVIQIAIAVAAWVSYGNWGVMMILLCGTLLALITGALPQWNGEKWSDETLERHSAHIMTRGNGHRHVMVFIGTPKSYNLEILATAQSRHHRETSFLMVMLAMAWACLLICTAGLRENAWFLVGIGGLGMLQNVYAAGTSRSLDCAGLKIKPFLRKPTIIGMRVDQKNEPDADVNLDDASTDVLALNSWLKNGGSGDQMPRWLQTMMTTDGAPAWLQPEDEKDVPRTMGALKELEKWVPTAGLALLKIFFPGNLSYDDRFVRDNVNKKFWKRVWHTKATRRNAEHARREVRASTTVKSA